MKVKYRGGEAVCIRPGCKRLAQNGKPGDFCGQVCRNKGPCVCPLRRMGKNGEAQTQPPTMDLHPLYLEQVRLKETESTSQPDSWLTNEFFFKAFKQAVKESGGSISDADKHKMFDFRYNYDLRNGVVNPTAVIKRRGGVLYQEPYGWKRFCIRVAGKYDNGDDTWLHDWAVAYHGCPMNAVPLIMKQGFKLGGLQGAANCIDVRDGKKVGKGIYCSPNLEVIECYANGEEGKNLDGTKKQPASTLDGHTVFFALMCRVNPAAIRRPVRPFARCNDEEVMGINGTFEWVINDPANIRPYAVLIRDKATACHQHLRELVHNFNPDHKPVEKGTFNCVKSNISGQQRDPHQGKIASSSFAKAGDIIAL